MRQRRPVPEADGAKPPICNLESIQGCPDNRSSYWKTRYGLAKISVEQKGLRYYKCCSTNQLPSFHRGFDNDCVVLAEDIL